MFAAHYLPLDTGASPFSVAMGDLNGDGRPDLVTANRNSNTVSVLLGNGDGTFGAKLDYGTGVQPASVAIGDVNGDRKPDLVTANGVSNTVSVLLGHGDGTFGVRAGQTLASGLYFYRVEAAGEAVTGRIMIMK